MQIMLRYFHCGEKMSPQHFFDWQQLVDVTLLKTKGKCCYHANCVPLLSLSLYFCNHCFYDFVFAITLVVFCI